MVNRIDCRLSTIVGSSEMILDGHMLFIVGTIKGKIINYKFEGENGKKGGQRLGHVDYHGSLVSADH